jgi:hypothetical protein
MRSTKILVTVLGLSLSGCGSITLPAAVKMSGGETLIGTTTAATSGGSFQVSNATGTLKCSGTYDPFDTSPVITAPVSCDDGRYGTITVTRAPNGMSGTGTVNLADGSSGNLAFGRTAASVVSSQSIATTSLGIGGYTSRQYTGNCPTPESIDAAGKRCGARSAASRPGGYDGYGSWSSPSYGGGSVYVRGYYRRNGTYVRSHYRRR